MEISKFCKICNSQNKCPKQGYTHDMQDMIPSCFHTNEDFDGDTINEISDLSIGKGGYKYGKCNG